MEPSGGASLIAKTAPLGVQGRDEPESQHEDPTPISESADAAPTIADWRPTSLRNVGATTTIGVGLGEVRRQSKSLAMNSVGGRPWRLACHRSREAAGLIPRGPGSGVCNMRYPSRTSHDRGQRV